MWGIIPGGVLMLDGLIALDAIHLNEAVEKPIQPVRKFLEVVRKSA